MYIQQFFASLLKHPELWPGITLTILVVLFAFWKVFIYFRLGNKAKRKNPTRAKLLNEKEQKRIELEKIAETKPSKLLNNNDTIDCAKLNKNEDESNTKFKLLDAE